MPLIIPATGPNSTDTYSIIGEGAAVPPATTGPIGLPLAAGQTINVVSSDPATVVIAPDASPQPAPAGLNPMPDGTAVPAGTPTVASGTVGAASNPAQPNVAITVTATVLNSDGSTAEAIADTVTVNPAMPASAVAIGELFGAQSTVTAVKKR